MTSLEFLLEQKGLSQKDLAEECGISKSTISRYIALNTIPSATVALKIADVLCVQVEDLFDFEGWREHC